MLEEIQTERALELPVMLTMPPKLTPVVMEFNDWRFFLLEGGRGGGKSQMVARFLLYLADTKPNLKILCGREVQNKIEESVHAMLAELIVEFDLDFEIQERKIKHKTNGAVFSFRGFIDRGVTNARGIEGNDIIWIDEAQQLSKKTVDDLIPTIIRKSGAKLFFTMNRFMYDDAIYEHMNLHPECLHIEINYFDNPFCGEAMRGEAMRCKDKTPKDYQHIWLGHPLAAADDYLFNYEKLRDSMELEPYGDLWIQQRVMGIDFAAQGNDKCVATIMERTTSVHWEITEQFVWDEPDTTVSVGKITALIGQYKPDVAILDVGGGGHNVHCDLVAAGLTVHRFDGGSTLGVDKKLYGNQRAAGYYTLKEWFDNGFLAVPKRFRDSVKQLEKIRMKFRNTGVRMIQPKVDMKKEVGHSPDEADSLMMMVYGAAKYLGQTNSAVAHAATQISRKTNLRKGMM